jgi:hypothetical protein
MGQIDIDYYCRVYDGMISDDRCDEYIELYEETLRVDAEKQRKLSVCYRADGTKICGSCNCMRLNPQEYSRFDELNNITIERFVEVSEQYKKDVDIHKCQWPKQFGWEELRIKRFLIEGGDKNNIYGSNNYHGLQDHVDVYSFAHAKRFLCLMVYLNDDFHGGETVFPLFGSKVKPKKGMVFVFPPTWTYLHHGAPPLGPSKLGAKYFLMTHANYIDKTKINSYDGKAFKRNIAATDPLTDGLAGEELRWQNT